MTTDQSQGTTKTEQQSQQAQAGQSQQGQFPQGQSSQWGQAQGQQGQQSQPYIDSDFFQTIMGSGGLSPSALGYDVVPQVLQSYFETLRRNADSAQRMADLWAQSLILQQTVSTVARAITPVVARHVIEYVSSHPELIQPSAGGSQRTS